MAPWVPRKIEPWSGTAEFAETRGDVGAGSLIAIVPSDFDGGAFGEGGAGKDVFDPGIDGPTVLVGGGAFGADADWRGEGERGEDRVVNVAAHVAEGAGAEVEPFTPVTRVIPAVADVRARGGDADPSVPIESFGDGIGAVGHGVRVAPFLAAPGMHFADLADAQFLDSLDGGAVFGGAMDLDAHLGHQPPFACHSVNCRLS
jgi:hypothetical protein